MKRGNLSGYRHWHLATAPIGPLMQTRRLVDIIIVLGTVGLIVFQPI